MLLGMFAIGLLFPERFFGGVEPMFETLAQFKPRHLSLPDSAGLGVSWYTSTALLCGLGMWMWPHVFAATYSARSEHIVRRNAGVLPLYQLGMVPVIIVGFTCAAQAARDPSFAAAIDQPDHALLVALVGHFPSWVAGLIGAGGLAAAVSTASALILTAANLTSRNLVQQGLRPGLSDTRTAWVSRALVPVITAVAVALVFTAPDMLVALLLMGYAGISQFVPAVLLGMFARWPTRAAILAGLCTGLGVVVGCQITGTPLPLGMHPGFLGLLANVTVVVGLSFVTPKLDSARLQRFEALLAEPAGGDRPAPEKGGDDAHA
jgi:SSS family solute:Na+ symporter